MSWAKMDDGLPGHPKVDALLDADELRGLAAIGLWALTLCKASHQLTDGDLTHRAVTSIAPEHGPALAADLVEVGFFDAAEKGWSIHDYLVYNPSRETVLARREQEADRKAAARAAAAAKKAAADAKRAGHNQGVPPDDRADGAPDNPPDGPQDSGRPSGLPDPTRPDPLLPPKPPQGGRARDIAAYEEQLTAWSALVVPEASAHYRLPGVKHAISVITSQRKSVIPDSVRWYAACGTVDAFGLGDEVRAAIRREFVSTTEAAA